MNFTHTPRWIVLDKLLERISIKFFFFWVNNLSQYPTLEEAKLSPYMNQLIEYNDEKKNKINTHFSG